MTRIVEKLTANFHDLWAQERKAENYTVYEVKNDLYNFPS